MLLNDMARTIVREHCERMAAVSDSLEGIRAYESLEQDIVGALRKAGADRIEEAALAYDAVHSASRINARGQPNMFSKWLRAWARLQERRRLACGVESFADIGGANSHG